MSVKYKIINKYVFQKYQFFGLLMWDWKNEMFDKERFDSLLDVSCLQKSVKFVSFQWIFSENLE